MKLHQGSCSTTVSIAATTTTVSIAGIAVARSALDETLQQPAPPHTRKVATAAAAAVWLACRVACFPEGATDSPISPAKTAFFEPFIYKMHHFVKTGSGQT